MPGFNGTSPRGLGPMTGRGMGFCAMPSPPQGTDLSSLKQQMETLQAQLEKIQSRIDKLSKK